MRKYYIYVSKVKYLQSDDYFQKYIMKYLSYECIGYLCGTKEVLHYFGRPSVVDQNRFYTDKWMGTSFEVPCHGRIFSSKHHVKDLYLIIDEKGEIRDLQEFYQTTKKGKSPKKRPVHGCFHFGKNIQEKRCSITPEERKEYQKKGFFLLEMKPKRKKISNWNEVKFTKGSRSWKDQSKRRHQWKAA